MRNQIFHSPGTEEAELAKIPGDGDPPHWQLYSLENMNFTTPALLADFLALGRSNSEGARRILK